jgi:hypothetical protein
MKVITCVEDLRRVAQKRVPRMFYDYADSGSWTESTYRANEADFRDFNFRQRVAVSMHPRSVATKMIGEDVAMPVALAPTGMTGMQHADGEILAARAAERFGVPFTLSTMSICSIEDVAANTKKPFWFQLYVLRDREFVERLIERAKQAKCSALMLTLDLQILGQRHKDLINGLSAPPRPTLANMLEPPHQAVLVQTAAHRPAGIPQHRGPREGHRRHGRRWRSDPPVIRSDALVGGRRVGEEEMGRQAHPRGILDARGCEDPRTRARRAHRLQPRRAPADGAPSSIRARCRRIADAVWARASKCGCTAVFARDRTC